MPKRRTAGALDAELRALATEHGLVARSLWTHIVSTRLVAVHGLAFEEATVSPVVLYREQGTNVMWTRPVADFVARFTPLAYRQERNPAGSPE